ncbi:hypothetical protein CL629_04430 [bacterium]|nr:hypothetical protein [bacterium]|tara:strand:- start:8803 stop:9858 length:1056 start_codon:yes stop_codon:yes gene_type:complete
MKLHEEIVYEDIEAACKGIDLEPLKNSRILLTGANGFLGSYFAHLFNYCNEKKNFNIQCDCITKSEISPRSRIFPLKEKKGFSFIIKDLTEYTAYDTPYDIVIYAAGYAAPKKFLEDPISVIDVNYIGIKSVLENVLRVNPKASIMYFSSSEIYGSPEPKNIPTTETYDGRVSIVNNRACYMESKRLAEVLCLIYKDNLKADIKIVRPALTYGPGLSFDDERVIGQFMGKAYQNKKIEMIDEGRDTRAFCYIRDALQELLHVLLYGRDTIYNIGSSKEEISIKELADIIGDIMGVPVKAGQIKEDAVKGAPGRVCLDMSKIEKEFNISPQVGMKEGLKRTIDWNKALIKEE